MPTSRIRYHTIIGFICFFFKNVRGGLFCFILSLPFAYRAEEDCASDTVAIMIAYLMEKCQMVFSELS